MSIFARALNGIRTRLALKAIRKERELEDVGLRAPKRRRIKGVLPKRPIKVPVSWEFLLYPDGTVYWKDAAGQQRKIHDQAVIAQVWANFEGMRGAVR